MKKIFLVCAVMLGVCFGVFADSASDKQFRQYVELTKKFPGNPEGMTVTADYKYRIIYAAFPVTINSSDVTESAKKEMKNNMLKGLRDGKLAKDRRVMKNLGINFVYAYITTDQKVFTINISYKEL